MCLPWNSIRIADVDNYYHRRLTYGWNGRLDADLKGHRNAR